MIKTKAFDVAEVLTNEARIGAYLEEAFLGRWPPVDRTRPAKRKLMLTEVGCRWAN